MRGVATMAGFGEIECEDGAEPVVLVRRIIAEWLPRAVKHGGMAATAKEIHGLGRTFITYLLT